jgi:Ca2+-dependent lipid-binding protein
MISLTTISFLDPENIFVTLSSSSSLKNDIKSTRVLSNKLNPTWNENLYQLITLGTVVS